MANSRRIWVFLPLILSFAYLAIAPISQLEYALQTSPRLEMPCVLLPFALIILLAAAVLHKSSRLRKTAASLICAAAPLALLYPWAAVPDNLGTAYGGYGFFREWLVKYPNCGPVNLQVLLGMLCVIGASCLPALFAFRYAAGARFADKAAVLLAATVLALEAAVLVRLDCGLLWGAVIGYPALGGGSYFREAAAAGGPLLRLGALFAMAWWTWKTWPGSRFGFGKKHGVRA